MNENEKNAKIFCNAIKKLSENPERLENLELYLSYHFYAWMKKFAATPENIAGELKHFSEIEI